MAVVGSGLAGLAAAVTAAEQGARVVMVDRNDHGGRAATDQVGRFRFNRGAHALYLGGPGMEMLRGIGIKPVGSRPRLRGTLGRDGDRTGGMLGMKLLTRRARGQVIRTLAGTRRWRPEELGSQSAGAWLDERGVDDDARVFLAMAIRTATYAADPTGSAPTPR